MAVSFCVDGFRLIYICVTTILWVFSSIFSLDYFQKPSRSRRYYFSSILTYVAVIGVFLSADLLTTFIFFELLSIASYPMVAHEQTPDALRAAETYLAVAVIGGMTTLMGLLMLRNLTGTLDMKLLSVACGAVADKRALYLPGALILVGFGAKAGLFPLHIWLPKAHPAAPAPASALLSGILTKCGVFGVVVVSCEIFRGDAGWGIALLAIGTVTMLLGAVLAVFSIDMKRTLACSSVSQIGFITVGIAMQCILGEHNALAVRGTILHMVNHSMFKLLLFLCAGVVYMNLHSIDFNKIRGFGRRKPLFAIVFLVSAAGIAGVPVFSGYMSKTLLHESIVEGVHLYSGDWNVSGILHLTEWLFIFTGGLTVAYMLKMSAVLFGSNREHPEPHGDHGNRVGVNLAGAEHSTEKSVQHNIAETPKNAVTATYMSRASAAILAVSAAAVVLLGVVPGLMDSIAGFGEGFMHGHAPGHAVHYFAWSNLRGAVYSLTIGAVMYLLVVRAALTKKDSAGDTEYIDRWPRIIDLENMLYRPFLTIFTGTGAMLAKAVAVIPEGLFLKVLLQVGILLARLVEVIPDAVVGFIRKTLLKPLKKSRFPGRFFGGYYSLVRPDKDERPAPQPVVHAGFSVILLLFGIGLCLMLGFLVIVAFS